MGRPGAFSSVATKNKRKNFRAESLGRGGALFPMSFFLRQCLQQGGVSKITGFSN